MSKAAYSIMTRVPASLRPAVEAAAARSFIRPSTYARQALCEKLAREGLLPSDGTAQRSINSLDARDEAA